MIDRKKPKSLYDRPLGFLRKKDCMFFFQDQYQYLAAHFSHKNYYELKQFANQEFIVKVSKSVIRQHCVVVGSLTAPQDQVISLLLLLHTLVQEKASSVILYSPYFGYQRQDVQKIGRSHGLLWADAMLHATGIQKIITIEPHCEKIFSLLQVPIIIQKSELIFTQEMAHFVSIGFTFVYPDRGAVERSAWIHNLFPSVDQGFFLKTRNFESIDLYDFQGKIGKKVIVYDDILDSGQTLVQTCIILKLMQVEEIVIFVTHALFNGQVWNDLWELGVKVLYCTDSMPQAHRISHSRIKVKSIAPLLHVSW